MAIHCNVDSKNDLLFFSEGTEGHRLSWLNILARKARLYGKRIHLVLQNQNVSIEIRDFLTSSHGDVFCLHLVNGGSKDLASQVKSFRQNYPDLIICTADAEDWLPLLLQLKNNLRIVFMRPYLQTWSPFGVLRYIVKLMCVYFLHTQRFTNVGLLSIPLDKHYILKNLWLDDVDSDFQDMANEVLDSEFSLRTKFNLAQEVKILLVPGFVSSRKNHQLAVLSFKEILKNFPNQQIVLVFAGRISQSVAPEIVGREDEGIFLLNEYLEKRHYFKSILDSDCIVLLYSNRGSSGIVIDAVSCNRRIIITGGRRWSNFEQKYTGLVYKIELKLESISSAMLMSLANFADSWGEKEWRSNAQTVMDFILDGS